MKINDELWDNLKLINAVVFVLMGIAFFSSIPGLVGYLAGRLTCP